MRILLLEDNDADARLMREALLDLDAKVEMDHVHNVEEGRALLRRVLETHSTPFPDLVLLDIRLPAETGIDLLRFIRHQHALKDLPCLMLTSSDREEDVREAREAGATTYYIKPHDLDGFYALAQELKAFWFERPRGA